MQMRDIDGLTISAGYIMNVF